ncbi:MAG: adenylate/guanylate cyclase domain-containing response regulator, partial [Pirellula sp.]
VVSCGNAIQALMFIETMRFDVCLVDLDMPEINGLELIKGIRDSKTSSDSSIIVVSGSPELFNASDAIDGGADDYLEKPANTLFLQARIRSCLRQSDARLAELSRFLPEDVAKRVSSNRELLETAVPADITVMVCDIRGFSRVSERVGPMRTIKWISDVMNRLSTIILNRGGTIIDYVGDEIMAMWGAPIASQDHATDACRCALAIQKAVEELSEKWLPIVGSPMAVGVGINSGLAVVGNTGSKDRIKFGPLGNTVNMASRVQGATKYLQSSVLITHETAGRIDSTLRGRKICAVRVQNIMEPVELYELADEDATEISPKLVLYAKALQAYEKQELDLAIAMLARLMSESPEDGPAKLLMMRVIQSQLGGGTFDPIWTLPGK